MRFMVILLTVINTRLPCPKDYYVRTISLFFIFKHVSMYVVTPIFKVFVLLVDVQAVM